MPSPEQIARAAVRDAALVDALTEDFATELATVLGKLRKKIQNLVQQLETNPDGRIASVRQNLALALRLRADIQTALQQSGYPELALRSVDQPLDDLAASVLKEVGKSPQVQLAAYDIDALVAMKELRLAELLQVGQDVAVQLWRVTLDGVVGARPVVDLVGDLTDLLEISQKRARVLYDTLVSTYSRQVAQIGTSGDPEEAFLYVGPDDERTRDFCDQRVDRVYSRGAIDQMDNGQLPNVMLTGGGYNCRHMFRRVSALDKELLDIVDTGTRYQDRNGEGETEPQPPVKQPLTDAEKKAIEDYTFGKQWEPLNEALRDGRPLTDAQKELARNLDSAIAKGESLPQGTTLYRGLNFGNQGMPEPSRLAAMGKSQREDLVRSSIADWAEKTYKPGDTFQLGGFQSTSREIQPALDASLGRNSPGVVYEIKATKGLDLTGFASKAVDDEAEVLLSRFTTYRVDSVSRSVTFENSGGMEVERTVIHVTQIFGGKK